MRRTPTNNPICCSRCGQCGGARGTPPLTKIEGGKYAHQGKCPPKPKPIVKLVMPTTEEVLAVKKTKEGG